VTDAAIGDLESASDDVDQPTSGDESVDGAADALGEAVARDAEGTVDGGDQPGEDMGDDSVEDRAAANLSNAPVEDAGEGSVGGGEGDGEGGVEGSNESVGGEADPEGSGETDLNPEKDDTGIHMGPASDDPEDIGDIGSEESVDSQPEDGAEPETEVAGEGSHTRTVEAGDTLSSIAAEEYGDPDMWGLIYEANKSPEGSGEAAAENLGEAELDAEPADGEDATDDERADAESEGGTEAESDDVDDGDSGAEDLQQAASEANTEADMETANIDDPDLIHPGDELEIPSQEAAEQFDPSEYETPDSYGIGEGPF
jgi:hypothetical protein